jgi:hypothetical protein
MTTREIALEASVRFTDRNRFDLKKMLENAQSIEEWLNRDLPKLKFLDNNGSEPVQADKKY